MKEISERLQFFIDLTTTQSKIKRAFDSRLGINGVGLDDFIILYLLDKAPVKKLERASLAKEAGISIADLTRKLPQLEKIGLIDTETVSDDVKKDLIVLNSTGEKVLIYAIESAEEKAIDLIPSSKKIELGAFITMLDSINK